MSAAQGTGADTPDAQEYAGELGGFVLARSAVDRVSVRRGDTDWLAAAWADPVSRVLVLDNARGLVRFGDKEAGLILVSPAEAPEGLRFLLGVDDAEVAYFGVMGPPGCLESLVKDVEGPPQEGAEQETAEPGQAAGQEAVEPEEAAGRSPLSRRKPPSRSPLSRRKPPSRRPPIRRLRGRKPGSWKPRNRKPLRRKPPDRKRLGRTKLRRRPHRPHPSSRP